MCLLILHATFVLTFSTNFRIWTFKIISADKRFLFMSRSACNRDCFLNGRLRDFLKDWKQAIKMLFSLQFLFWVQYYSHFLCIHQILRCLYVQTNCTCLQFHEHRHAIENVADSFEIQHTPLIDFIFDFFKVDIR